MPFLGIYSNEEIAYLDAQAASALSPGDRIRSIWPYLVRTVLHFHARLRGRRRINYDPEDILSHLYLLLLEKDGEWDHRRGAYFSFAYRCVQRELQHIDERASTVHSAHNSRQRAQEYEDDRREGRLTEAKAKTLRRLRQAMSVETSEHREDQDHRTVDSAAEAALQADHDNQILREVRLALGRLPRAQAAAVTQAFGLGSSINGSRNGNTNGHSHGVQHMASACGCSTREFHSRLAAGIEEIRGRLSDAQVLSDQEKAEIAAAPSQNH